MGMELTPETQRLGQLFDVIEMTLLDLEEEPENARLVDDLFESLKQTRTEVEASGLSDFGQPIHSLQLSLNWVREGRLLVNQETIDFWMMSIDSLRRLLVLLSGDSLKKEAAPQPPPPPSDSPTPPLPEAKPEPAQPKAAGGPRREKKMIRVDAEGFAGLSEVTKELMVQHTILAERGVTDGQGDRHLRGNINTLGEVIDNLQVRLKELRMVPLKTMFSRMGRLVREVAQKTGKRIDLQLEGEETEVDRQLIDEINDPLVHLLRNAVDHGVETPAERQAAEKEARGTIRLQARRQGDQLLILIQDDGRGLDREAIFQKGLERGLLDQRQEYSDGEIFQMILHPGFSTAKAVSEISGRGVGMDVVTKAIRRLKGELEIASQPGEGTTFTIRSPLDLAIAEGITDGIVVRVGCENYVIPVNSMVEAIYPKKKEINRLGPGNEIVRLRGENYSLIRLHRLFGIKPEKEDPWEAAVIIAEAEDKRLALMVDEIVHQQRAVVRGLNRTVFPCRTVSGLALMGDEVGLVIDINGIAESLFGSSLSA